jgi:hypothetical protein
MLPKSGGKEGWCIRGGGECELKASCVAVAPFVCRYSAVMASKSKQRNQAAPATSAQVDDNWKALKVMASLPSLPATVVAYARHILTVSVKIKLLHAVKEEN